MSTQFIDPRIKKYKNIITINPYINSYYEYKNQELKKFDKLIYDDKQFTISYATNRDLIIASLDLGYDVDEEEIEDTIYMKAYEELGLDDEKEYTIHHQKANSDKESNVYNVFISEPEIVASNLSSIVEEIKYIDLLIPAPLLYGTLYNNNVLENKDAHCYIYFTMKDAFVTVYKDGEFIYSKSIEFSLEQIYDKYCALVGEKIDKEEFFEVLESEGLKTTNSIYQQNLMKLFGEVFLQINDIIIYTKRAYNIPNISKLFLGSVKSPIIGLGDYGYNYLGIPTFNLDFNFDIKNDEWYVDQLQYLMVKSGLDYLEGFKNIINISNYPRPPVFTKRSSGQFILSVIGASLLAIGIPLGYLIPSYTNEAYNLKLNADNQKLSSEVSKYKKILSDKQAVIKTEKKKLKELKTIFESKAKTLTSIYEKKVNYNFKSDFLHTFAKDLKKYSVHVEKIVSNQDEFTLHLLSADEKSITKYIKYISKEYSMTIKNIDIKRIEIDDKDKLYRGILKVSYR
ncbi:FIG00470756: hypothetical protein [hydrothermal vent metagenome]|uniref:Uncharacterized protein n=1 Tax=hydrothermal vent metagenome TaxID=652676 RepID=A0A1W1CQ87_9ZZZZ